VPSRFDEEIFKEIFRWQLQRRQAIDAATAMPTTVVVVLIGGVTYFARQFGQIKTSVGSVILLTGITVSSVALIWAIVCLCRTIWEYQTADLPAPKVLAEHIKSLREYYKNKGVPDVEKAVEDRFREQNVNDYCVAGQVNFETNARRAWYLFWARRCIIVATAGLAIAGIGFALAPRSAAPLSVSPQPEKGSHMAEQTSEPAPQQASPTPQTSQPAPNTDAQPPERPPLEICRASRNPDRSDQTSDVTKDD
jgi:hypothetical protein